MLIKGFPKSKMGSLSHFLCKPLPPLTSPSAEDAHIFNQDPVDFPLQWIFHHRQLSTQLTLYMLAMFLFERTADVQNGPLFCFSMCWTECVGR